MFQYFKGKILISGPIPKFKVDITSFGLADMELQFRDPFKGPPLKRTKIFDHPIFQFCTFFPNYFTFYGPHQLSHAVKYGKAPW